MTQTKNGVVYTLHDSPFVVSWGVYKFYFSSAVHMEKFKAKLDIRSNWLNDSMSRRFHFTVDVEPIAIMQLYCQVETRGFLVYDVQAERYYVCQENIILHGMTISESD